MDYPSTLGSDDRGSEVPQVVRARSRGVEPARHGRPRELVLEFAMAANAPKQCDSIFSSRVGKRATVRSSL
jgi:hypothetical protein